ncbi:MAG: cofactor-independent phosphoglycerate mutase [Candidatus Omnitrophota bacterium]
MKYIMLVPDGMADRPIKELDGRTPLEAARTPNMDRIAKEGRVGRAITVPGGMEPASDVANLSILGYNPKKFYTGRGPLEAANMGVELGEFDVAFRCNLVTTSGDIMSDYSSGHISSKEAGTLIEHLNKHMGTDYLTFYPGVSYRHLAVLKPDIKYKIELIKKCACVPPHNIMGKRVSKHMPKGKAAGILIDLMNESRPILEKHDVNKVRIDLNENPANMIWLWGQGGKPNLPGFYEKYSVTGSIISAVDLIKGIGKSIGLDPLDVPGATGYYDTDYEAKGRYAIDSLKEKDFVFVHVEAPDEAGHNADLRAKIAAIENFDSLILGRILRHFEGRSDYRIMLLPDHATPICMRTHSDEPVPFVIFGKGIEPDEFEAFSEVEAAKSRLTFGKGWKLMDYLIKGKIK